MRNAKHILVLGSIAITSIVGTTAAMGERDALACGGCFNPPENPTVVTDHRMILSVSKEQSTLYDQIKYSGSPSSFAWVLPISATVTVGLSADVLFSSLDQSTQTQIIQPPRNCPSPSNNCPQSANASTGASSSSGGSGGVTVLKKEVVGPYETVQLQASDPTALQTWLSTNGFNVPADVQPIVDQYVLEKFNFLALKLQPGKETQDMRPVRVSTKGANVALPLRMVAAGTGPNVGISLWVVSEGRYEPQNFQSFVIKTDEIAWDWNQNKSNYTELRAAKTAAGAGKVWEIESSIELPRTTVESIVKQGTFNNGSSSGTSSGSVPQTDEERAAQDYLPVKDPQTQAITKTAAQVRDEDLTTLFQGIANNPRVTRMRADLAHAALNTDLLMTASNDQAPIPNVRQVTKELNQPVCPVFQGCESVGTAPRDEAIARSASSADDDSTFTCNASTPQSRGGAYLGIGLGALAVAEAFRRRHRKSEK